MQYFKISFEYFRSFNLINPTSDNYNFKWKNLSEDSSENESLIQCLKLSGKVEKGETVKMTFSSSPDEIGVFETFWLFEIKEYDLKTLFLIVANVMEPSVCCKCPKIKMNPSVIGKKN